MSESPVITVTVTVMDGTVVRWFRDLNAAENMRAAVSASRNGVSIHAEYLTDVPKLWVDAALEAYGELKVNRDVNLSGMATHRHRGAMNGPLVPVEKED